MTSSGWWRGPTSIWRASVLVGLLVLYMVAVALTVSADRTRDLHLALVAGSTTMVLWGFVFVRRGPRTGLLWAATMLTLLVVGMALLLIYRLP